MYKRTRRNYWGLLEDIDQSADNIPFQVRLWYQPDNTRNPDFHTQKLSNIYPNFYPIAGHMFGFHMDFA